MVDWPDHGDERGFFRQTYQISEIGEALGREVKLVQGNRSRNDPGFCAASTPSPGTSS